MQSEIRQGEALSSLFAMQSDLFDAVITDPPYCSGSMTIAGRAADPAEKYCQNGDAQGRPSFAGDNRDQRSFAFWCSMWLTECWRVAKPGAYCLAFTDWRQLPTMTDAIQAGGWTWRGIIAWDKTEGSRSPNTNYFRHQCEYVVWGSKGAFTRPPAAGLGPWPGCFRVKVRQSDKHHMTGKPTELMRSLVQCCPIGGKVLDPFAGSGTTIVAAAEEGRIGIGIEQSPEYIAIARRRLAEAIQRPLRLVA